MAAAQDRWEFYCVPDPHDGELNRWAWRLHNNGTSAKSEDFQTFVDCYLDAVKHGFTGHLNFSNDSPRIDQTECQTR
jgi:hypothetical protein